MTNAAGTPALTSPLVVAVLGPTAAGKSALALALAEALDGEILCCDALQLRAGLPLLTAKPTADELGRVRHHLVGVLPAGQAATAARYVELADRSLAALAQAGRPAILCGGSGLYLRALCEGLFAGPAADPRLRKELRQRADSDGIPALHRQLQAVDSETAARLGVNDYVRIERALEVYQATGRPLSEWLSEHRTERARGPRHRTLRIGLDPGAESLRQRIVARSQQMVERGLLAEVAAQRRQGELADPPLGYDLCCQHLDGLLDLDALVTTLSQQTAQYARRQRTWFRREPGISWYCEPAAVPIAQVVAAVRRGDGGALPASATAAPPSAG